MKSNFERALAVVLRFEGGWSNHPRDPGGATMKGVTQKVYDRWRSKRGEPTQSVRTITEVEAPSAGGKSNLVPVLVVAGVVVAIAAFLLSR